MQKALLSESLSNFHLSHFILFEIEMQGAKGPLGSADSITVCFYSWTFMQCKEWDDANSELFKESHDEAVHKNSYKSRLYE